VPSTLSYGTFLGGSGDDQARAIAVDAAGNIYVAGGTSSTNFPVTSGAYDSSHNGGSDAFVAKFYASGSLAWATYLGGSGDDYAYGIAVDGLGNVYVTGDTNSTDFPIASPRQATNGGGYDAFVAVLNAAGSALNYSTYLGGSGDDHGYSIAVDGTGAFYVTGSTSSTDFPTVSPLQLQSGGGSDAFVAKFNAGGTVAWATYLGGSGHEYGYGVAVDSTGIYIAGYTDSTNFPTTAGAYQQTSAPYQVGPDDGFVAKLDATGTSLVYSTYLGGNSNDWIYGLAVDGSGNAYMTGVTRSTNFPATANAFQGPEASISSYPDAFVTELNAAGSALNYSTYLGGKAADGGQSIAVDHSGNIYVAGVTTPPTSFPTLNAYDATAGGTEDAFVAKLNPAATSGKASLLDSTYLGGKAKERGLGIAVFTDSLGNTDAYVAGRTTSSDFPTTPGAYDRSYNGGYDAFVAKLGYASSLLAANTSSGPTAAMIRAAQIQPLTSAALARRQAAGVDTRVLGGNQIQLADLGGRTLGLASGHTIYLDENAAGWSWLVDQTPWQESEVTTPDDQGEKGQMNLLTVLMHEPGHTLGSDHKQEGVMLETSAAGEWRTPEWLPVDALFAPPSWEQSRLPNHTVRAHAHR
jgi:hypothetical protein